MIYFCQAVLNIKLLKIDFTIGNVANKDLAIYCRLLVYEVNFLLPPASK
ncbi:hypothetical protein RintRC_5200 [Richelia intracellularis]|nr:hypothetical protein RintRC_5200 [Richelia intracellularis]